MGTQSAEHPRARAAWLAFTISAGIALVCLASSIGLDFLWNRDILREEIDVFQLATMPFFLLALGLSFVVTPIASVMWLVSTKRRTTWRLAVAIASFTIISYLLFASLFGLFMLNFGPDSWN